MSLSKVKATFRPTPSPREVGIDLASAAMRDGVLAFDGCRVHSTRSVRGLVSLACVVAALIAGGWLSISGAVPTADAADDPCPNAEFRTGFAANLPDCRAYEQVSPQDKNGYNAGIFFPTFGGTADGVWPTPPSTDGNGLVFSSVGVIGEGAESGSSINSAIARRDASGWSTRSINPGPIKVFPGNTGFVWQRFSDDLSRGIVHCEQNGAGPKGCEGEPLITDDAIAGADNYYLADLTGAENTYDLLFPIPPPLRLYSYGGETSKDLTHAAFELKPDQDGKVHEGFIDASGSSQQRVVSVVGGVEVTGSLGLGYSEQSVARNANPQVISDDGTRILFTHPKCCRGNIVSVPIRGDFTALDGGGADLYLRDTGPGGPSTTWISEPEPGVPPDPTSPRLDAFWGASADASKIFFTSGERLTADATGDPSPDPDSFGDLYVYDYDTGDLRDISIDAGNPEGGRVRGVVGVSDDGDDAYFVAQSQLGTGKGTDGEPNLFHWSDGPGNGELAFIATLAPHTFQIETSDYSVYWPSAYRRPVRVTPTGNHLLFESLAPLTSDDLGPLSDRDVFHYDSDTGSLVCVSCGAEASDVEARLHDLNPRNADINSIPHNLTDDGTTAFFETPEALVATDTNGVRDVYQWDAATDTVDLISDGKDANASFFGDATPDGSSVFFLTGARLTPSDGDDIYDVYAARVGGGLASQQQRATAPCEGDACQGDQSAPPRGNDAGSAGLLGSGNVVERRKACTVFERRTRRFERRSKQARRMLRRARKARNAERVRRLRKRARRKARQAKRARKQTTECRRDREEAK